MRVTNHETRITAFTHRARQASATKSWRSYRVLRPAGGQKGRLGCRARGAFVLSKRAARDARALRADELRLRRREGASFSQIRCLHGRSVRPGCARDAQPETAARTAAPAAQSLLPCPLLTTIGCSLLPTIARNCSGGGGALSKCPQLPSPCGLLPLRRTQNEPMLRKGNVLYCVGSAGRSLPPRPPALYIECGIGACQGSLDASFFSARARIIQARNIRIGVEAA